jgi:MarC family membrane protein
MPLVFAITALVTLFVVVDPIGLAPTFLAVTEGLPRRARRDVAVRASLIAGAILIGTALIGDLLLRALGISLPAFRIAGGLLLFAIAFEMVLGVRMRRKGQAAEEAVEEHVRNIAAFPLAIPLMAGPGAITATVLLHRPSNDLRPTSIIFEETEVSDLLFYFASTLETAASLCVVFMRAVRAGLELVAAVGALKTHAPLQTRVGIATGLVVVGDLIGSGASQEQAIVGETPNLTARLQGVAEPNAVVISESTRKLVGNLFELQDLGGQDLKGIAGPVRAWAALRPASVESRFDALHATGLTELVGREEELELLLLRWSKAKDGQGQVVLLSGESGIGKSRLTAALLERLAAEPLTRLRYFCSPQHTDSAFYPIIRRFHLSISACSRRSRPKRLGSG